MSLRLQECQAAKKSADDTRAAFAAAQQVHERELLGVEKKEGSARSELTQVQVFHPMLRRVRLITLLGTCWPHCKFAGVSSAQSLMLASCAQAQLEALEIELAQARKEASGLRDGLSQKEVHLKAAKDAEANLARRLSHAQTSATDSERSALLAIEKAQADAAASERKVSAQRLSHDRALEEERDRARASIRHVTEDADSRVADARASLADCEALLKVRTQCWQACIPIGASHTDDVVSALASLSRC
jgi:hypothetical protein